MRSTPLRAALAALAVLGAAAAARPEAGAATEPGRITLDDFKKQLDAGKLMVIDVRSADSYRTGHIPGSISVPLGELEHHLPQLKAQKKPIVAYCA
jgi:3-mercaptopyruvate sulfurtransferase SseA